MLLTVAFVGARAQSTDCTDYATIPYSHDFEGISTGGQPPCWTAVTTGVNGSNTFPSVYVYAPNTRNGNGYYEFEASSSSSSSEIAALPLMQNLTDLKLTMWVSSSSSYPCRLEVGVWEEDNSTFVPVDTLDLYTFSGAGDWKISYREYTVYFNEYTGSGERIAIRATRTGSGQYTLFIDDLTVTENAASTMPSSSGCVRLLRTAPMKPRQNARNFSVSKETLLRSGSSSAAVFAMKRTASPKSYIAMPGMTVSRSMTTTGSFVSGSNSTLFDFVSLCVTRTGNSPFA